VQAYNFKYNGAWTPLFCAASSSVIEVFLNAGLEDDLELVKKGETLLNWCAARDILTEAIVSSLVGNKGQLSMKYGGFNPIEMGEKEGKLNN
jgi:hypothetical protein